MSDKEKKEEQEKFQIAPVEPSIISPEYRHLSTRIPVFRHSEDRSHLVPVRTVGKVRLRVLDSNGVPQAGRQLRVSVRESGKIIKERTVTAGTTGYVTTEFHVSASEQTKIAVREMTRERLRHEMHRDRMIEEIVEGVVDEVERGHSSSLQAGGGVTSAVSWFAQGVLCSIGYSIGSGAASSESFSSGHREVTASSRLTKRTVVPRHSRTMIMDRISKTPV